MSPELHQLYVRLADGERHSGAELARQLGISRAAVWKRIESLRRIGLPVSGTAGGGYRIDQAVELLDAKRIRKHLSDKSVSIKVTGAVDSTNARLAAGKDGIRHAHALIAEAQTAGRGRRGRGWLSPPGGIYLSLGWHFECGLAGLSALSLVVGMAAARAIEQQLAVEVKVKWPNDLVIESRKVGGCLVEISGAAEGPCQAVIGVGLNLYLPADTDLDQTWTILTDHCNSVPRNRLIAELVNQLAQHLRRLESKGFESFGEDWQELDALAGRPIRIIQAGGNSMSGQAQGIDEQGRLLVQVKGHITPVSAGEASVRER